MNRELDKRFLFGTAFGAPTVIHCVHYSVGSGMVVVGAGESQFHTHARWTTGTEFGVITVHTSKCHPSGFILAASTLPFAPILADCAAGAKSQPKQFSTVLNTNVRHTHPIRALLIRLDRNLTPIRVF